MVNTLYPLPRDPQIAHDQIGYSQMVGLNLGMPWDEQLSLGQPLVNPMGAAPIRPDLLKSVEFQCRGGGLADVIVERLYARFGDELRPYRLRVRSATGIEAVHVNEQLGHIHRIFGNGEMQFIDPRLHYLDALRHQPHLANNGTVWGAQLALDSPYPISRFTRAALDVQTTQNDLDTIAHIVQASTEDRRLANSYYGTRRLTHSVMPGLPVEDGLTARTAAAPITIARLLLRQQNSTLDLRVPPALPIEHPHLTLFSPAIHARQADLLDRLAAADVDVAYILHQGMVLDCRFAHYYDRYHGLGSLAETDRDQLTEVASGLAQAYGNSLPFSHLGQKLRVRLRRTFNDEALAEIFVAANDTPLIAIHFDFARLSLCGLGLTTNPL